MQNQNILIVGGGIGGLTSGIALCRSGHKVTIIEKDPDWSVYGVGIIQQGNAIRAVKQLGIIDEYLDAGFGFDFVEIFTPTGRKVARIPSPKLVEGYPASVGIGRRALHKVLGQQAQAAGANVRLGVTAEGLADDGTQVTVRLSHGGSERFDIVIGADGLYSRTRQQTFPDGPKPAFTGQAVWRYNFSKPHELDCLQAYEGAVGAGLVPLSSDLMYMFVTTPEPENPRYPVEGLAATMRGKLVGMPAAISKLATQITDDSAVVYKPLETLFLSGDWHKGRTVLLGDAVHATTPHLGQGAGMAIEDSLVLADEIDRANTPDEAFVAYRARRHARCKFIVETSLSLCLGQIGTGPVVEQAAATKAMFEVIAQSI
ncbi:2-polyprenyl-6-methoxyphenol hydroxylase [Sphingobium sp. AP50]|uniref:FAD-dependent oxidoreductase n=1 Tax=Sphingobium sp. AP50 TaxID=1884369 RepID=UPI0008C02AB9|nr:FAD-dependent oxidoreductase [Sphingobium sp. AP50]SEJ48170.1 2-polyprenyl-6-methoxyphenol hydroxylase [Sphingobium sp. AP50]